MKEIKVLGSGCSTCRATIALIQKEAETAGVDIRLEKVEDIAEIMRFGVMSTPGVVIDGTVVHAGGLPSKETVQGWLRA